MITFLSRFSEILVQESPIHLIICICLVFQIGWLLFWRGPKKGSQTRFTKGIWEILVECNLKKISKTHIPKNNIKAAAGFEFFWGGLKTWRPLRNMSFFGNEDNWRLKEQGCLPGGHLRWADARAAGLFRVCYAYHSWCYSGCFF